MCCMIVLLCIAVAVSLNINAWRSFFLRGSQLMTTACFSVIVAVFDYSPGRISPFLSSMGNSANCRARKDEHLHR